jgi:hypothetical protein
MARTRHASSLRRSEPRSNPEPSALVLECQNTNSQWEVLAQGVALETVVSQDSSATVC